MLFLAFEDVFEQLARDIVAHGLAMGDRLAQHRHGRLLEAHVAVEDLAHVLADHQLVEILEIGQPAEKEDPIDQPIGMLHLVDQFLVLVMAELGDPPVPQHAGMQEVLVDGGQFVFERAVQVFDNARIGLHNKTSLTCSSGMGSER